jgi:hypothetical protein
MHEVKSVMCCMIMSNLTILPPYKPFTKLPLAFLVFLQFNYDLEN